MFKAKTTRIDELAKKYPEKIKDLEEVFKGKTNVYIDYENVYYWQEKLGFHIDYKRLKQLFDSFDTINLVKVYKGTLTDDEKSCQTIKELNDSAYIVRTKPVKIMKLSIDVSSIPKDNPSILKGFIEKSLFGKFDLETIEYLNGKLAELNARGMKYIRHLKCNFDVEIASDMLIDCEKDASIQNFVLWSGDSDFADTITQLQEKGKSNAIVGTARRISIELSNTKSYIFEVKKIKEFICWKRELK